MMESLVPLEISRELDAADAEAVLMHLRGCLAQSDVKHLRSEIERLLDAGFKRIDLDFQLVAYIDSIGIAELVPIYQSTRARDAILTILRPRRLIRHILLSAHLDDILEIGPACEEIEPAH
jgi:anti-anti-sigma factor